MPATANMTVYDGTGVDKTFKPVSNRQLSDVESILVARGPGAVAAQAATASFRTRLAKDPNGVNRQVLALAIPHSDVIDGKVVNTVDRVELTFLLSGQANDARRAYLLALLKGTMNAGNFTDCYTELSHFL
jgi:hypothetical protein